MGGSIEPFKNFFGSLQGFYVPMQGPVQAFYVLILGHLLGVVGFDIIVNLLMMSFSSHFHIVKLLSPTPLTSYTTTTCIPSLNFPPSRLCFWTFDVMFSSMQIKRFSNIAIVLIVNKFGALSNLWKPIWKVLMVIFL